jgi:hypothetical protein
MVSRYRRGSAVTSTPEGQEWHLHGDEVVKDRLLSAPYPLQPLGGHSFKETDRTCRGWLGAALLKVILNSSDFDPTHLFD